MSKSVDIDIYHILKELECLNCECVKKLTYISQQIERGIDVSNDECINLFNLVHQEIINNGGLSENATKFLKAFENKRHFHSRLNHLSHQFPE